MNSLKKQSIQENQLDGMKTSAKCLNCIAKVSNKMIYKSHILLNPKIPNSQNKWVEYYPFLEAAPRNMIYKIPFLVFHDTYIKSIQYKILHRIFNCNYNLYIWGIKSSEKCDFCDKIDTLEHYLFSCDCVNTFWKNIEKWLKNVTGLKISFSVLEILLGNTEENDLFYILILLLLLGKNTHKETQV